MTIENRIIFEAINKETGAVISRDAIMTLDTARPDSIDDIGLTAAINNNSFNKRPIK